MSRHNEWADKVLARHDAEKPFAPENGGSLRFAIGDRVVFTNDYGAEFERTVTGFYHPTRLLYAQGYRYLVNSDSPWMPVKEASLRVSSKS